MVKGQSITAAQQRRLLAKINAVQAAELDLGAYLLELSDAGVSAASLEAATGEKDSPTFISRPTLHRMVQRARASQS
jgi:hypothetical protein